MVYEDEGYIYKEAEFGFDLGNDVVILRDQDGRALVVIDDHLTGDQLAEFKVIEEEEC